MKKIVVDEEPPADPIVTMSSIEDSWDFCYGFENEFGSRGFLAQGKDVSYVRILPNLNYTTPYIPSFDRLTSLKDWINYLRKNCKCIVFQFDDVKELFRWLGE